MSISEVCDQVVYVYAPVHEEDGMTLVRKYQAVAARPAHVEPVTAVDMTRLRIVTTDIDHVFWFAADPEFDERHRLKWRDTIIRPKGPAVDLHGLGEVWVAQGKALADDNEGAEFVD